MMDLEKACREFGVPPPLKMLEMKFRFWHAGDVIVGHVAGVATTQDGLPFIEVSNRLFAGMGIKGILLDQGMATLITTERAEAYRRYIGKIEFYT